MLQIKNLYFKNILHNINLSIEDNIIIGLFGSSGSGKSSLLKCIKGFYTDWTGEILYNQNKINKYDTNMGYILQEPIFFNHITLMDNFLLVNNNTQLIIETLHKFNLQNLLNKNINTLSGGEKQKLNIIRCILMNPKILLVDEPTSAMDEENRIYFYNILKQLNQEQKTTIILVSHDNESKNICNKIIYMHNGTIIGSV